MRIRSIKPEFWRSRDISGLSIEDRLLFIGLWSYVDDNGVGKYDIAIIAADLFAHDLSREPIETLSRVSEGINRLSTAHLVDLYEVENKAFIHISTWEQHQRVNNPNKPRYPLPTCANESLSRTDVEPVETLPPGTVDQGNSGSGEQWNSSSALALSEPKKTGASVKANFEEFYKTYPRKMKRADAEKAYKQALNNTDSQTILEGVRRYAADPNLPTDKNFIPYPATWLRAASWDDEPLPARPQQSQSGYRNQNQIVSDMQERATQRTFQQQASLTAFIEGATA